MIKLSKVHEDDEAILVMDQRPASICRDLGTEPLVYLGRITPRRNHEVFRWESRWGGSCGDAYSLEEAQARIEVISEGMYK